MACSRYVRFLLVLVAILFVVAGVPAQPSLSERQSVTQNNQNLTIVTVRWGPRPGVTRYRLQLSRDAAFGDIVFDRVVAGHEYRMADLAAGKYFWRVASMGAKLGEFSAAGVIEVRNDPISVPKPSDTFKEPKPKSIATGAGWYAAIGSVADPVLARLRSANVIDVVSVNADGRTIALDALTGIALWSTSVRSSGLALPPVTVRNRSGLDDVLVFSGGVAMMLDGRTGREIWRSTLPGPAASAIALNSKIFIIDNSLQKLFIVDGNDGKLISQLHLPRRAAGAPAPLENQSTPEVMIALDDGRLQVIDQTGKVTRSADAGSPATTAPLFVRSARGALILIGTKNGLTALNAADLRPLGRISLKDDAPRGVLAARDLDGDGIAEVVMFTDRGRVVVTKSDEGKLIWEGDARRAGAVTFADVNNDRVLDLLMAGREGLPFALSGRDGVLLWEEVAAPGVATNHAQSPGPRSAQVAPSRSGVLLIVGDPTRGGLRAVEFSSATSPK